MIDLNRVTVAIPVDHPTEITSILEKWRKEYGKNVADSRVENTFEYEGKLWYVFSYRNCLTGEDAKEIDEALVKIASSKSTKRKKR